MGDIIHKTISVTSWDEGEVIAAHAKAAGLGLLVTYIHKGIANNYFSFFVLSSGSKEGWDDENEYEGNRRKLCGYMRTECKNLSWCESVFGHELDTLPYVRDYNESEYRDDAKHKFSIEADEAFEGVLVKRHEFTRAVAQLEEAISRAAKALEALCPGCELSRLLED